MTDTPTRPTGRGGPDRGQGRHPLDPDAPTVRATVTLPADVADFLTRLGGGNLSAGVRIAARIAQEAQGQRDR
jgi:hypothetical protein